MPSVPSDLPLTPGAIVIAGIALTFLINGLLDYAKSFALLARLPGDVYRGASFVLGIVGFITASYLQKQTLPTTPEEWILLVVLGLAEGLAAGTAYDDRKRRKFNNVMAAFRAEKKANAEAEASTAPVATSGYVATGTAPEPVGFVTTATTLPPGEEPFREIYLKQKVDG